LLLSGKPRDDPSLLAVISESSVKAAWNMNPAESLLAVIRILGDGLGQRAYVS
jgi:hypothetical protein